MPFEIRATLSSPAAYPVMKATYGNPSLSLLYGLVNGVKIGIVSHNKNRNTRAFPMSLSSYWRKKASLGPFLVPGMGSEIIYFLVRKSELLAKHREGVSLTHKR